MALLLVLLAGSALGQTNPTEEDLVKEFFARANEIQKKKLGWISAGYTYNRINRANDYNRFTNWESAYIDGGRFDWLDNANTFNLEFGVFLNKRFSFCLGGEYWMELGQTLEGTYTYAPPLSVSTQLTDPSTKIRTYSIYTGLAYYLTNPPDTLRYLERLAFKVNGTVGFYNTEWDVWSQYENLNLSSSLPEGENMTFNGSAPGFSLGVGAEYPTALWDLALAFDVDYLYLNFSNIAWYNSEDEEVVITHNGEEGGRADLQLSGFRAQIELKRFFSW